MLNKVVIETSKVKSLIVTIQHVFRGNFNDTYWLEEMIINLDELKAKEELTWFDPFNGRSKINNTLVAIAYVSDDKFVILEKKNDIVTEKEVKNLSQYILCEKYDETTLLASHIRLWY